jgi:hypothetical protein
MRLYDLIKVECDDSIFDNYVENFGHHKIGIVIYMLNQLKFAARADKKYTSKYIIRIQDKDIVIVNRHKYNARIPGCSKTPVSKMDFQDLTMAEVDMKTLEIYGSLFVISKVLSKKIEKTTICQVRINTES